MPHGVGSIAFAARFLGHTPGSYLRACIRGHVCGYLPCAEDPRHSRSGGWAGVELFFVLSGFLITSILLDTRERVDYWKNFYLRRALRILPLYLVTLLIIHFWIGVSWLYVLCCLVFIANLVEARMPGYGPLWSLAVEEQFYLVWPFLVRRLRLRSLAILCLISIAASPLLRILSGHLPLGNPYDATWLISHYLSIGAFVGLVSQ